MEAKEFKDVVKLKIIPATFVFRCTLCGFEISNYDRHLGLIKMNEHISSNHSTEVNSLGKEDLYSRKPEIILDSY
jgi:hypothetical protein